MKLKIYFSAIVAIAVLIFVAPANGQTNRRDTSTTSNQRDYNNDDESLKSESQLNQDRTDDAKALKKEYKAKARDARRIEKDAANASKQANKSARMEKRAQKARKNAEKQSKKADRAAQKSDNN